MQTAVKDHTKEMVLEIYSIELGFVIWKVILCSSILGMIPSSMLFFVGIRTVGKRSAVSRGRGS